MNEENKIHPNDDLWYALESNGLSAYSIDEITDIVAEVPGSNDEYNWYWILKLTNGKYTLLDGWCDYTGWDRQSGINEHDLRDTPRECALDAPDLEEYSTREIKANLLGQLDGSFPLFTYWEGES